MNNQQVEKVLRNLLFDLADPVAISLKGPWGTGKTHFVRSFIAATQEFGDSAYISLFGVSNIAALKIQVATHLIPMPMGETAAKWFRKAMNVALEHFPSQMGASASIASDLLLQKKTNRPNFTVFLDDLERADVDVNEIFGVVDLLREQTGVNVVLVFNEDELESSDERYRVLREKAIDRDLLFESNFDPVFILLTEAYEPTTTSHLKNCCSALDLANIRILKRILLGLNELVDEIPEDFSSPNLEKQIISTLVLASTLKFAPIELTTVTDLRGYVSWQIESPSGGSDLDRVTGDDPELTVEQKRRSFLESYGYSHSDELDKLIIDFVDTGVLDSESFKGQVSVFDEELNKQAKEDAFRNVWSMIFNSFDDCQQELVDRLNEVVTKYLSVVTLSDINNALGILKDLDESNIAERLLAAYVSKHGEMLENLESWDLDFVVRNPMLAEEIEKKRNERVDSRTFAELVDATVGRRSFNQEDVEKLANSSEDEYTEYFDTQRDGLVRTARHMAGIADKFVNASDGHKLIQAKTRTVLKRKLAKSKLNKVRLEGHLDPKDQGEKETS